MRTVIKKWGNSASVRIPSAVMEAANLYVDAPVDVREEEGRVVIELAKPAAYDLDTLVAAITPENRHDEVESGPAVGKEAF